MSIKNLITPSLFCVVVCVSNLFSSCDRLDSIDEKIVNKIEDRVEDITFLDDITLSETELEFDIYGGSDTITVSSDNSWTATVPENVDWVTVSPETGHNSTKVVITVAPNDRVNPRSVSIYFTAKRFISSKVTIKQGASDATLQDIELSAGTLSPEFSPSIQEYTVEVGETTDAITINGIPNDETTAVKGNGEIPLTIGNNKVYLITTSKTGAQMVYIINVRRSANPEA